MNSNSRVLVIGDSCIDQFVYGTSMRLCPDGPVPVFSPLETVEVGGMAENTKANIISLNHTCDIITHPEQIYKTRYVDKKTNHMFIRVDTGETHIKRIKNIDVSKLHQYGAIAISDYNKGFLHEEDVQFICENHPLVFVDTKKHIGSFCENATFIKINELEYNISKHILSSPIYADKLIVTLGSRGCRYMDKIFPVDDTEVKDMSGAGDTFLAGLIQKYLSTKCIIEAIKHANFCATKVVQKRGVTVIADTDLI